MRGGDYQPPPSPSILTSTHQRSPQYLHFHSSSPSKKIQTPLPFLSPVFLLAQRCLHLGQMLEHIRKYKFIEKKAKQPMVTFAVSFKYITDTTAITTDDPNNRTVPQARLRSSSATCFRCSLLRSLPVFQSSAVRIGRPSLSFAMPPRYQYPA